MKELFFDDDELVLDDPNIYIEENGTFKLEPGDPGYVPPPDEPSPAEKPKKKKRNYMASNPTPEKRSKLIAASEDMADGMHQHEVAIGLEKNTEAKFRPKLEALKAGDDLFKASLTAQVAPRTAEKLADSNVKGFIASFIKTASDTLGNDWSDAWIGTGLPDNTVGIPGTKDARFTCIGTLKTYLTANPDMEVSTPKITVTAAKAALLHTALSDARNGVAAALRDSAAKEIIRDSAEAALRTSYRSAVNEIGEQLDDDDPKWYDFGLSRPSDPEQPEVPENVTATAQGGGDVLVKTDGALRASSYNYYKKVVGVDAEPVKVKHTDGEQFTIEDLPAGATVEITVAGVNDAGEGQPSAPVVVTVT